MEREDSSALLELIDSKRGSSLPTRHVGAKPSRCRQTSNEFDDEDDHSNMKSESTARDSQPVFRHARSPTTRPIVGLDPLNIVAADHAPLVA